MSGSEVKKPEEAPGCLGDFGNAVLDCGTCSLTRECYKRTTTRNGGPVTKSFYKSQESAKKDLELSKDVPLGNTQVGGDHYEKMGIDPWDVWDTWPLEQRIGAYRSNAVKYLMRMGTKDNPLQELKKARHYINKLIEVVEGDQARVAAKMKKVQEEVVKQTKFQNDMRNAGMGTSTGIVHRSGFWGF